uniref:Non-specific protein-tyrosine kinase n=1 Tax=Panagrolaimus sp. JU765 TaxID=591449 RepID=A0AC34QV26_9BILA
MGSGEEVEKNNNQYEPIGNGEKGGSEQGNNPENQENEGGQGGTTVVLKANADNQLEQVEKEEAGSKPISPAISPANNQYEPIQMNQDAPAAPPPPETANDEEESESSDDGILAGLQSDDVFHGMLPDEDIARLVRNNGDYILHTVEKEEGKGRVIGMTVFFNDKRHFIQVKSGGNEVTFDMIHYKKTILDLTKYHLEEKIPVTKEESTGAPIVPTKPILRETWELRHSDILLEEKLGEGAFGEVRKGVLQQRNKGPITVAVKVIKGDVTKEAVEEAMKEARIMRRYVHPNVVRFYGVQAEIEPFMLVMEFVKGGSLDGYLKKNAPSITVQQKAHMCCDAAMGLEYLHMQGCIHRDIAARNCLMDILTRKLKLSDFGLSCIGNMATLDPKKPAPIRWLAPEVIKTAMFGKPADVWSFGILCWEIYMDAAVPYKEYSMAEVQTRIQDDNFRLKMPMTCQTEIRKLVSRCWIGHPNNRPSMADCVKVLKPLFDEKVKYMSDDAVKQARKKNKDKKHKKKKVTKTREEKKKKDENSAPKPKERRAKSQNANGKKKSKTKSSNSTGKRSSNRDDDDEDVSKSKEKLKKKKKNKRGKESREVRDKESDHDRDRDRDRDESMDTKKKKGKNGRLRKRESKAADPNDEEDNEGRSGAKRKNRHDKNKNSPPKKERKKPSKETREEARRSAGKKSKRK